MNKEKIEEVETLVEAHWSYVRDLLLIHQISSNEIDQIGFHYTTAMVHGYKHGWEDAKKGGKIK